MIHDTRIGIIGAGGWLGGAIAQALIGKRLVLESSLTLSYRSAKPDRFAHACWTQDNQALVDRSDVVIVSVRPQDWPALNVNARGKLVVSVMAGIRMQQLVERHRSEHVVRTLPNAAAEVGYSYTPWLATPAVTPDERSIVCAIFDACGVQDEVASEADIDYLTGLTGTGPAYFALLSAAMMRDAVLRGLPPDVAQRAVNGMLIGAGRMLELRDANSNDTVDVFLDYQGVTAAGIQTMRARGFDDAVMQGLAAALNKSIEMGG